VAVSPETFTCPCNLVAINDVTDLKKNYAAINSDDAISTTSLARMLFRDKYIHHYITGLGIFIQKTRLK
jgi:hypothetical protein